MLEQARNSATGGVNIDSLKLLCAPRRRGPARDRRRAARDDRLDTILRSTAPPRTPISIDFGPQTMPAPRRSG